ncbi:MAG: ATP-binding protein [Calditrichaeota bacterium]|nr:MAG: ATP-binding protein [Calditrichota bacterium]MBL1203995.1 ATP-binding protein [Calditrichota bacterium]NOG43826.1 ATP-binding protein [Calditrichota bacterium]
MNHFKVSKNEQGLLLEFNSYFINVDRAIEEIVKHIKKESDYGGTFELNVILREVFTNAIRHGNQNNPQKKVWVKLFWENGEWQFNIKDEGIGFNPSKEMDQKSDVLTPHGMGLTIISSLGYDLHYNSRDKSLNLIKENNRNNIK